MKQSEQIELLAAALVKVQETPLLAARGAENPYFKSKYADLVEVWRVAREVLPKNNIVVVQAPFYAQQDILLVVGVTTTLIHTPSGQWMSGDVGMLPQKTDAQAIGSCITYARRYGLASMVGIVSPGEDDDGNAASSEPEPEPELQQEPDEIRVVNPAEPVPGNPVPTLEPFNKGPRAPTPKVQSSLADPWWKTVVIPFGKNKGSALGNLPKPTIFGWWANWQPKPYKGRISEVDAQLRKALDMAGIYYKFAMPPDDGSPPF